MTMNTHDQDRAAAPDADRKPVSRRVMLRGAAAAVPAILTLHSGSALARSSNMLSLADGVTGDGPALCLDVSSLPQGDPGSVTRYDLGSPPEADITSIRTDRTYYRSQSLDQPVTPQEMCQEGGTYYYKSDAQLASLDTAEKSDDSLFGVRRSVSGKNANEGWTEGTVTGRGGFVSATALASFVGASGINIRNI